MSLLVISFQSVHFTSFQSALFTRIEYLITQHALTRYLSADLPAGSLILDVGCGPGRYAIDLARQDYRVVLCDLLCEMLRKLVQKRTQGTLPVPLKSPRPHIVRIV